MPVSTRSQIFFNGQDDTSNISSTQRARPTMGHQETHPFAGPSPLRNPHHGLKEKMKALTLMYEQQKQAAAALRSNNNNPASKTDQTPRFSTHPSVELFNSCKNDEKTDPEGIPPKPNALFPPNVNVVSDDSKENNAVTGTGKIVGLSCPRRNGSVRKLSMGNLAQKFEAKNGVVRTGQELETSTANTTSAGGSEESRDMVNDSRILVFVRLRPMGKKEKEAGSRSCVRIVNKKDVYLTEFASENDYLRLKRLRGRHFTFDSAFPDSTSQQEVYSMTTAELVEGVLQGRNGSVFCYGATGAGKTYTMLGTLENPGVMVLAIKDLFTMMRQRSFDGHHSLHLSYLEVYNETVRDLLSPGRPLVLREDKQGIVAAGLTQYRAYSTDEVMSLLQRGNQNRTTEPTRANETSSRSHAILQIVAEYQVRDAAMNIMTRVGKLSLIDLAGSERALATDQRTLRSIEGANINRSLLALSSCINALVEGKRHIPYRNSKLTQLLKDSLGGACNTVMIANISPSNLSFGETQNTLHWADRAKEIRTKACETVAEEQQFQVIHPTSENTDQAKLLLELQKENRELRVQLARQQQKLLTFQAQSLAANSSSPTPSSATTSILSPPPPAIAATAQIINEKRWTRSSILAGNCFNTPESKRRVVAGGGGAEEMVRVLQKKVKALEAEVEKMKTDHALQIKQKDEIIRAHLDNKPAKASASEKRIVTRASLRARKSSSTGENNELKSPSHRFLSPAPTAKKRSFWDITTTNSPLTKTLASRKTRSSVGGVKLAPAPSMLLQPGFAREKACVNEMGK